MSVILQPYQAIPFNTSLDFQVSKSEGGSLCTFENLIDEGTFIPFAILSQDEIVGNIEVYDCDDNWLQSLSLTIQSVQDAETGLWFHYYNGDDIGLSCGTYYLSILVGDLIWYSEQFTIRDIVNTSQYPELIKDNYHLPLRIYDSITKQLANKTDIGCDVHPLNPVSTIMPFMFDTDEDIDEIEVYIVDTCSGEETDLSADLELEFIKESPGGLVEQDVLTTSQQLRNEFYEFNAANFVFQEFKINDSGDLKDILFEYYFGNISQTLTIDLILGINPSAVPVITKTVTDNAATSKELTLDYSGDAIPVTAGEVYILKIATNAVCIGGVGVNSVKVYPDGRFAERNTLGPYKEEFNYYNNGEFTNGLIKYIVMEGDPGDECNGTILNPVNPATYSFRYTATEDQPVVINSTGFGCTIDAAIFNPALVTFAIKLNASVLYTFVNSYTSDAVVNIPNQTFYRQLAAGDLISLEFSILSLGTIGSQAFTSIGTSFFEVNVFSFGQVIGGIFIPIPFVAVGTNYQNKSLWFYVNITKDVYVGGTGATKVYNPGRPLPSPLICGNYYLKLVSALHTWYSEWFRVINVGDIDLTVYVLGTEDDSIIITEDETSVIEV